MVPTSRWGGAKETTAGGGVVYREVQVVTCVFGGKKGEVSVAVPLSYILSPCQEERGTNSVTENSVRGGGKNSGTLTGEKTKLKPKQRMDHLLA